MSEQGGNLTTSMDPRSFERMEMNPWDSFYELPKYDTGTWEFSCCDMPFPWYDPEHIPVVECPFCFEILSPTDPPHVSVDGQVTMFEDQVPNESRYRGYSHRDNRVLLSFIDGKYSTHPDINVTPEEQERLLDLRSHWREYKSNIHWSRRHERDRKEEINKLVYLYANNTFQDEPMVPLHDDHIKILHDDHRLREFLNLTLARMINEHISMKSTIREIITNIQNAGGHLSNSIY